MKKYRASFFTVDFLLVGSALMLFILGILAIFSTGVDIEGTLTNFDYGRQLIFGLAGVAFMVALSVSDHNFWDSWVPILYVAVLVVLFFLAILGREINASRSWVGIAGFGIQPAEFSKLTLILMLSRYFSQNRQNLYEFKHFIISGLIVLAPVSLIMLQPDLGTSVVHLGIYFIMALIGGINPRYLFFCLLVAGLGVFLSLFPLWDKVITPEDISFFANIFLDKSYFLIYFLVLLAVFLVSIYGLITTKLSFYGYLVYFLSIIIISSIFALIVVSVIMPYQVQRLLVFIDPNIDPRGSGWNVRQSVLAIGSGGFWGQGYLQGFHSHSRYVPAQSTDFIFSIVGEEWGFLGSLFVFSLFFVLLYRIYSTLKESETYFGAMLCVGIMALFFIHFLVNVGMAIGLFPIMGIPLPFISYGGSALLMMFMSLGIVLSVYRY